MISDESNAALDPRDGEAIVEAARALVRRKGFTLYRLAALSRTRYPQQRACHIRRNFYSQLRAGLSPTFQQVQALAELTDSRLWDWLAAFGFSLGNIPWLQAVLPKPRTGLIDKDLVDAQSSIPFFRYRRPRAASPTTAPMSQLLERAGSYAAGVLTASARRDLVYAKIGTEDTLAFPDLLAGSVLRADPRLVPSSLSREPRQHSSHLFLVEHSLGLNCGRLRFTAPNRIAFVTDHPALANVPFHLGTEARILGVIDLELRFAPTARTPAMPQIVRNQTEQWNPSRIASPTSQRPGAFLAAARLRAGLSFRSASKLSRFVAKRLSDHRYFTSPGTLSDYEASDKLPRHIHKLFTLAIVYGVLFRDLLRAFGIVLGDLNGITPTQKTKGERTNDFFENLQNQFGDVPLFLAKALPTLAGLAHLSLPDIFWLGKQASPSHPLLRDAVLVLVNRRNKKPRRFAKMPPREQPLYLLQERGDSYLAGSCGIEGGRLVLYSYPQGLPEGQTVRRYIDADVVGQIVGIARFLVFPP